MTFLPIVERELRAAGRRPATHWMRFFAALATLTVWLGLALSTPQSVPVAWLCAFLLVFVAQSGQGISDSEWNSLITSWFILGFGIDLVLGLLAKRRLQGRFREIAFGPLSKKVKAQRADATEALSFGNRPLNSARP